MRLPRCSGGDEEVLQVAHVIQARGAAVEEVMHEADELLAHRDRQSGYEGMHGFIAVKEALPSGLRDFNGQGGCAFAAIERSARIPPSHCARSATRPESMRAAHEPCGRTLFHRSLAMNSCSIIDKQDL